MEYIRQYGSTVAIVLIGALLLYRMTAGRSHPLNGAPAPDFTLPHLNGETVRLADHKGKDVVVLDFWASWCPPCRKGLPVLDAVATRFQGQNVAVYAINIREGHELVSSFVNQNKLSLDVLLDDKGFVAEDYGVSGIPQTVVIDRFGTIQSVHVGVSPFGFEKSLVRDIESALAAPATE